MTTPNDDQIPGDPVPVAEVQPELPGVPPPDNLTQLLKLVETLVGFQEKLAELEELAIEAKAKIRSLEELAIPDLLSTLGLEEITLRGGGKLMVKDIVFASLPKTDMAKRDRAFAYLEAHNMAAVIKEDINVPADRKNALIDAQIPFSIERYIHPSTLKALVTEQLALDPQFPIGDFGGYVVRKAVLK